MRRGGFRRRLTIAFVLVAAVSSGSLAVGSFLLVRQARLSDLLHAKASEVTADLKLAHGLEPTQQALSPGPNGFVQAYGPSTPTVLLFPGRAQVSSDPRVNPRIPVA